jgi:hypothetical protein
MSKITDNDDVVRDGSVLRVPLMLMDTVQRAVVSDSFVGHRPGSLPLTDGERDRRVAVYGNYEKALVSRWKNPSPNAVALGDQVLASRTTDAGVAAYSAYEHRLTNAWRGR